MELKDKNQDLARDIINSLDMIALDFIKIVEFRKITKILSKKLHVWKMTPILKRLY